MAIAKKKPTAKKATVKPETEEIVVTEEYLAAHPDAAAQGVEVGMTIEVPKVPTATGPESENPAPKREPVATAKKGEGYSIVKNGEYIRTYAEKDVAEGYLKKEGRHDCEIVLEGQIAKIVVEYDKAQENGTLGTASLEFSPEAHGKEFKEKAILFRNEKAGFAKAVLIG